MGKRRSILFVFLFVFLIGAAVAGIPLAVMAGSGTTGAMDYQAFAYRGGPDISTSSGNWSTIPGLEPLTCSRGLVSATVSVNVSGAPAQFRVNVDEGPLMNPPFVTFAPGATTSFSYTFVDTVGPFEASNGHSFAVEWRSPTHGTATFHRGDISVQYRDPGTCNH